MASNTKIEIIPQAKNADKIIDALKAVVKSALCQGFTKTSFLVRDHIKYIKKIQSANDPELHIIYTAKSYFLVLKHILKKLIKYMLNMKVTYY